MLGEAYVKHVLDAGTRVFKDQRIYDAIEDVGVNKYCLLLPFIDGGKFDGNMAVLNDDWDVGGINSNKCLSCLCEHLFQSHCSITCYAYIVSGGRDDVYSVFETSDHLEKQVYDTHIILVLNIIAYINMFLQ